MQYEIMEPSDLLDERGFLVQKGWARQLLLKYERKKVKSVLSSFRIKEWDCYEAMNDEYGISLIIADIGYFAMATVSFQDYRKKKNYNGGSFKLLSRGSLNLPPSADAGDAYFYGGHIPSANRMSFVRDGDNIILKFDYPKFPDFEDLGAKGELTFYKNPTHDTMVNVIPFNNPRHFVYVQKANCMPVNGVVTIGESVYEFSDKRGHYGCLDWTRSVFPYRVRWHWGSASGLYKGDPFGFNLDAGLQGFGDESIATKNMIFLNGKGHKIEFVTFHVPKNIMDPWKFTSSDDRFEMVLHPVSYNRTNMNFGILKTGGFNVYGYYTGDVVLDNGDKLHIDKLFGFAEEYGHRW
ncbi:MAG: DUF2804 domain-containing protein [Promethearchaeota archaeon]|nr:MAG: DUF2804 domain-containing protein [Candidatus Lokiarchaeota archaeon]